MSAPQPPEAAVEEMAKVRAAVEYAGFPGWDEMAEGERAWFREECRAELTAALPHLHRDWLEGLIGKAEWPGRLDTGPAAYRKATDARAALPFLRAELAEGGDGE